MWTKLKIQLENAVFPYNPGDVHNGRSIFAYRGSIILWTTSVRKKRVQQFNTHPEKTKQKESEQITLEKNTIFGKVWWF